MDAEGTFVETQCQAKKGRTKDIARASSRAVPMSFVGAARMELSGCLYFLTPPFNTN